MTVARVGADGDRGATAAHTLARAQTVARWLTEGFSSAEAHRRARELWGVSHRTASRLVAAGRRELMAGWDIERDQMLALLLSRFDAVFKAAIVSGNHNAAVAALNAQAKLAKVL
jgi:hypothetical protein